MFYKVKVAVCSEIRTKHINAMWEPCRIFECWTWWYVKLPLGFKRLNEWLHIVGSSYTTCILWRFGLNTVLPGRWTWQQDFACTQCSPSGALHCSQSQYGMSRRDRAVTFQASAAMLMRSVLMWDSWPLKVGPIRCPETSVNSYHTTPRNIPKNRRFRYTGSFVPTFRDNLLVPQRHS
jgi:hypothetical protein